MVDRRSRQVLVDTNIVLLFFIGTFDRDLISRFKRTCQFTVQDFDLLSAFLAQFENIVTTPNILSEVSNLSGQLGEPAKMGFFTQFARQIRPLDERYVRSDDASQTSLFPKLGLTDSAIFHLAQQDNCCVLTDDFELWGHLQKTGIKAINFNHLPS